MTPATKLLIVLGGGLVLLAFVGLVLYPVLRTPSTSEIPVTPVVLEPEELNPLPAEDLSQNQADPVGPIVQELPKRTEASQKAEVEGLARLFLERHGSYSNFSNYENVNSLKDLMTSKLFTALSPKPSTGEASDPSVNEYLGVTTQLINLAITDFTAESKASLRFTVQRETQKGINGTIAKSFKDGLMGFVFVDGKWLVDRLEYK